ncbi:MAG TPA: DUF4012 domain-containing protein, partial [Mycobacteriales bacterium]|nr:DUF4012 domain-containing protein [Mycobacteriales bacterium]
MKRLLIALPVLLLLAAGAWLAYTGLQAKRDLVSARDALQVVRHDITDGQVAAGRQHLAVAAAKAHAARDRTDGPLWTVAAHIPWLGRPFDSARGLAQAADTLTRTVLPPVVDTADRIDPKKLRVAADRVDLAPLSQAQPALATAAAAATQVQARVDALPSSTWLSPVDDARHTLATQLHDLTATLTDADLAARLLPPMLGADGKRSYFVTFQNPAEARGTGGIPGAFGILDADHGRLHFRAFYNDTELGGVHVSDDFGPDFAANYGSAQPQNVFVNSNMSPHFPYAAQLWLAMWQQKTGEHLDGALATDPVALSYLLRATGPTTLTDGTAVSGDNIVALTLSTAYARFPDVAQRKQFFLDVAHAAADHILHGSSGHTTDLVKAMGTAAGEGRFRVWSAHPAEQALIAPTKLSGVVPEGKAPYSAFVVENAAGSKLDYYLGRQISWTGGSCGGATRRTTVTVKLTNHAPASGLPDYGVVRADQHGAGAPRGSEMLLANLFATEGAQLAGLTLDGQPHPASLLRERGHPVYELSLQIDPGQTRTLTFTLVEPAAKGAPRMDVQPLV